MSLENLDKPNYNQYIKTLLFGVIIWIIPFAISFFMYDKNGNAIIPIELFNSIMSVVLALVTIMVTIRYFENTSEQFVRTGISLGILWLVISLVLDYIVLFPLANLNIISYIENIALGYLVIPIITISSGILLNNHINNSRMIISKIANAKTNKN